MSSPGREGDVLQLQGSQMMRMFCLPQKAQCHPMNLVSRVCREQCPPLFCLPTLFAGPSALTLTPEIALTTVFLHCGWCEKVWAPTSQEGVTSGSCWRGATNAGKTLRCPSTGWEFKARDGRECSPCSSFSSMVHGPTMSHVLLFIALLYVEEGALQSACPLQNEKCMHRSQVWEVLHGCSSPLGEQLFRPSSALLAEHPLLKKRGFLTLQKLQKSARFLHLFVALSNF